MSTIETEVLLFKALNTLAPGKYQRASVLCHPCRHYHLKGSSGPKSAGKDYNLSYFRFIDGRSRIKCLYNCGLEIWNDKLEDRDAWKELSDLLHVSSTNSDMGSESVINPAPDRFIPEAQRKLYMQQSQDWKLGENFDDAAIRQKQDKTPDVLDLSVLVEHLIRKAGKKLLVNKTVKPKKLKASKPRKVKSTKKKKSSH